MLAESIVIGLLSAVLGIGGGVLMAQIIITALDAAGAGFPPVDMIIAPLTIIVALVVAISICFIPFQGMFLAEHILQFLLKPIVATMRALGDPDPTLQFTSPQEYLFTLFRISMVFGFAMAFPMIANQMWRFVVPGPEYW